MRDTEKWLVEILNTEYLTSYSASAPSPLANLCLHFNFATSSQHSEPQLSPLPVLVYEIMESLLKTPASVSGKKNQNSKRSGKCFKWRMPKGPGTLVWRRERLVPLSLVSNRIAVAMVVLNAKNWSNKPCLHITSFNLHKNSIKKVPVLSLVYRWDDNFRLREGKLT